jgi:hypothetical protein
MKNGFRAFAAILLTLVLLVTALPVSFPASAATTAVVQPLSVQIATDKTGYGTTAVAVITVTVKNTGLYTLSTVTAESIFPSTAMIFGTNKLIVKAASLAPNAVIKTSFSVCLNPSKVSIDAASKKTLTDKINLKKISIPKTAAGSGVAKFIPDAFSFKFDTAKKLTFGKISITQTDRVSYKYDTAGSIQGTVVNALTGAKIAGANIDTFRTTDSTVTTDKKTHTVTDANGNFKIILVAGTYNVTAKVLGYVSLMQYSVTVTANNASILPKYKLVPGVITTQGKVGGIVTDAVKGAVLEGVTVKFRMGWNEKAGYYFTGTTGADGKYSANLALGNYTAEFSKVGYVTGYLNIYSLDSAIPPLFNIKLKPSI